ncbi:unnamed protein product [Prunus armeniaca]
MTSARTRALARAASAFGPAQASGPHTARASTCCWKLLLGSSPPPPPQPEPEWAAGNALNATKKLRAGSKITKKYKQV